MSKVLYDSCYTVYPGDDAQLDLMLSRFYMEKYTQSFSVVTTEYYNVEGQRYFKNRVKRYVRQG